MKTFKLIVVNFILVSAMIICVGVSRVEAFHYLGEFCWDVTECEPLPQAPWKIKLAVSNVGDQHFILNGRIVEHEGSEFDIIHGNAEIIDSNVVLTLNSSGSDEEETWIGTLHATLSLNSLNGTYNAIWKYFEKDTGQMVTGHCSGTFTFVSCP